MTNIEHSEQLKTIANMLERTRYNIQVNSIFYLIWGWLVFLSVVVEYVLLTQFHSPYHWIVWPISMPLAGVVSAFAGRNQHKNLKHTNLMDTIMKFVWLGITAGIIFSLVFAGAIGWKHSYILIILFCGIGTFISGGVLKFKPLTIGGILSVALSFIIALVPALSSKFETVLLLLALSIIMSYLVPGYILKYKANEHV